MLGLTSGSFLIVGSSLESETVLMKFSFSVTVKSIGLLNFKWVFFTNAYFCDIMYWSFGKYWCTALCRSSKGKYILLIASKISQLLISPPNSCENFLVLRRYHSYRDGYNFQKFWFSFESSNFITGSNAPLYHYRVKCLQNTSSNNDDSFSVGHTLM